MLGRLLPRFLKAAKHTLTGDVSNHVVVVALGPSARNVCSGLTARYSHQCVEDPNWGGPEGQYDVGDEWFAAVSMNKLELVLNVMTLGYSVLWCAPRPRQQGTLGSRGGFAFVGLTHSGKDKKLQTKARGSY